MILLVANAGHQASSAQLDIKASYKSGSDRLVYQLELACLFRLFALESYKESYRSHIPENGMQRCPEKCLQPKRMSSHALGTAGFKDVRHWGSCAYSSGLAFTPKEGEREGEEEGWRESTGGCRGGKAVARARGVAGSAMAMRGPGRRRHGCLDPVVAGE